MEQYKVINTELTDLVQKQRITIGEMLKTEVMLKKQLLEEREIRLANEQYNEYRLKCAIRTLLQSLDLNLDDHFESLSTHHLKELEQASRRSLSCGSDLRRSSYLLQQHMSVSPIRRSRSQKDSSCQAQQKSPLISRPIIEHLGINKTLEPRHTMDLQLINSEESLSVADASDTLQAISTSTDVGKNMYSIIEESDGEGMTFPLVDLGVENKHNTLQSSQKTYLHQRALSHDTISCTIEDCGTEPNIERVRLAPQTSSPCNALLPCSSENSGSALTPRFSELRYSRFAENTDGMVYCSSPHEKKKTFVDSRHLPCNMKVTNISSAGSDFTQSNLSSIGESSRISRKCRPGSLKEPSLKSKLRNTTK